MLIIPVLDIRGGVAVQAVKGLRDRYAPVTTPLCPNSRPLELLQAYRKLFPFTTIYIADLDAILGTGDNRVAIAELHALATDISLWVDAGFSEPQDLRRWVAYERLRPVIGSETVASMSALETMLHEFDPARCVLSLDFRGDTFLGPPELLRHPDRWPQRVIIMDLERIGAAHGPLSAPFPAAQGEGRRFYAAGGVRDARDIRGLAEAGYCGALVASALHAGRLGRSDIIDCLGTAPLSNDRQ